MQLEQRSAQNHFSDAMINYEFITQSQMYRPPYPSDQIVILLLPFGHMTFYINNYNYLLSIF